MEQEGGIENLQTFECKLDQILERLEKNTKELKTDQIKVVPGAAILNAVEGTIVSKDKEDAAIPETRAAIHSILSPVVASARRGFKGTSTGDNHKDLFAWEKLHQEIEQKILLLLNSVAGRWKTIANKRSTNAAKLDNKHAKIKYWTNTTIAISSAVIIITGIVLGIVALGMKIEGKEGTSTYLGEASKLIGGLIGVIVVLRIFPSLHDWKKPPEGERALTQLFHSEAEYYNQLSIAFEEYQADYQNNRWQRYQFEYGLGSKN